MLIMQAHTQMPACHTFVVTSFTELRNTASEVRLVVGCGPLCFGLPVGDAAAAASSRACGVPHYLVSCLRAAAQHCCV